MSKIPSKKINRTPLRSPSPDNVHKNINQRTPSPINEALSNRRMAKSPKTLSGRSFMNNEQYQNCIQSLQEQNRRLSKENSSLLEQNIRNLSQIDFLKEMNLKSRKQLYKKSQPHLQQDVYAEYQKRIGDLIAQIRRIQDLLSKQIRKNQQILKQNEQLKYQRDLNCKNSAYEQAKFKKQLNDTRDRLNQQFQQRMTEYEEKVQLVLNDEIKKLNKLEHSQSVLRNMFENRRYQSPISHQKTNFNYSTYKQSPQAQSKRQQSTIHEASFESQTIQCQKCKEYFIKIAQLQGKINVREFILNSGSKLNIGNASCIREQYLLKLTEIRQILNNQQVKTSIECIETNLNDIYSINYKFEYMTSQKNKVIQQLREKEIKQSIELISLKKEIGMLKVQINEQNEEIFRLQELIKSEVASFRQDSQLQLNLKTTQSVSEADILRKCLEQATSRINNLQNQIKNSLEVQT